MSGNIMMPPNLRDIAFEVIPKFHFDARTAYEHELDKAQGALDRAKGGGLWDSIHSLMDCAQTEPADIENLPKGVNLASLRLSRSRIVDENKANEAEEVRLRGEPVCFGAACMLRHDSSKSFLSVQRKRADYDVQALKVCLVAAGDDGGVFSFLPAYKSKRVGERLLWMDIACIHSNQCNVSLHASTCLSSTFLSVCL